MENHDITLKNLSIIALMVTGFFLWMKVDFSFSYSKGFDYRASFVKNLERNPTAEDTHVETVTLQKIKTEYRPNLEVFENKRAQASLNVVEDRSEKNSPHEVVRESNFEATRNEITKFMTEGRTDEALELARKRLEENVPSSNEMVYMGFLHDFIMQNTHDPEEQYSLTYSSIKNAQDKNIRKQFIQKFAVYQPEMAEDMKREIQSSGLSI
ncbi:MAG: hypothetical protein WCK43_00435 [bacterium]